MVGERRIVTVLFCDVKGSTSIAEMLDPEEWAEIMNGAFRYLIEPVYRYEGTLARLMGDAILAFFGAPIAHEDDPYRGVRAGLEIIESIQPYREQVRRTYNLDLNVRIGINTGLVVVGEVGSDLRMEYTAMGDAVNVAARMEQTAEPGTVQISANTHKLVSSLFDFEPLGEIELKGKTEPVQAYRVLRARPGAVPERGIEGLHSPLVGRDRDLLTLQTCLNELMAGRGQIVSVMGEAGLGKSRLVAEARKWLHASTSGFQSPALNWYEGRSYSYDASVPYAPFISLFTSLFGIAPEDKDTGEQKYAAVRAGVAQALPGYEDELAPLFAALLGIELSGEQAERVKFLEPPQMRARIFAAVRALFEAMARTKPTVLVFEDLHWVDPTSLELLEQLMPLTDSVSLMLLALFRPIKEDPSWRFHEMASREYHHRYTPVALAPLDDNSARQLVANLLEIEDLPAKVRDLILTKAEGNPFFVEEVIRSLLDMKLVVRVNSHWRATRDIENITVPDTLAGVITARLDRLEEHTRQVAHTASVIGREFALDVLQEVHDVPQVLDDAVSSLQRRELVREKSLLPRRVYMFKHVLTQESAYSSVLLSRRRKLHRQVAECLERRQPELAYEIARHFLASGDQARALPYLTSAGDQASRANAVQEAIGYYSGALKILETVRDPSLARRAYEGLGRILMFTNPQHALQHFEAMRAYGLAQGDIPMQISALNKLAQTYMWLGRIEDLMSNLAQAEELARQYEDLHGLAENYTIRCGVCNSTGDFQNAAHYLAESTRIGEMSANEELKAFGLTHTAMTRLFMAQLDEAREKAEQALQLVEQIGHRLHESELRAFIIPNYHLQRGELDEAQRVAEQGLNLSTRIGAAYPQSLAHYTLGSVALWRGEYQPAIENFQQGVKAGEASGYPPFAIVNIAALGRAFLEVSPSLRDTTAELHQRALQMMEQGPGASAGGSAWIDIGLCALALGDIERAASLLQMGLTVPTNTSLLHRPRYQCGLAEVYLARGQLHAARELVADARQYAEEHDMPLFYPLVAFTEGRVHAPEDCEQAVHYFEQAYHLASAMLMRPLMVRACKEAAQVSSVLGNEQEAQSWRDQADRVTQQIADLLHNPEWRALYLKAER
jgi:predicted ATPase/class 3 adenylate cyclase